MNVLISGLIIRMIIFGRVVFTYEYNMSGGMTFVNILWNWCELSSIFNLMVSSSVAVQPSSRNKRYFDFAFRTSLRIRNLISMQCYHVHLSCPNFYYFITGIIIIIMVPWCNQFHPDMCIQSIPGGFLIISCFTAQPNFYYILLIWCVALCR